MSLSHPHMPEHVLYVGGFSMDSSAPQSPTDQTIFIGLKIFLSSDIIPKVQADRNTAKGFDIGTGTNCIYPLLGASLLGWKFVGSGSPL